MAVVFETESEFDAHVFRGPKSLARTFGWLTYHTLRSKGSQPGFPDRTCTRERVLFVETKGEKTPVAKEQVAWLTALAKAGAEVYLWRPSDLPEVDLILARRWRFEAATGGTLPVLAGHGPGWTPASLWLPTGHRADA